MATVLVTGIGGDLARRVAAGLAQSPGVRVLGADRQPGAGGAPGVELLPLELRGAELRDLLQAHGVEVVVHLAQLGEEQPFPAREAAVRGNVIATIELLGACAAAGVRRAVLRSSTLVYGPRHDLPLYVREDAPLHAEGAGLTRDYVEIERFVADFAPRRPGLAIGVLRCAGLVGAEAASPLRRYLSEPMPRTWLGFDPLIQALHPEDAARAFVAAALADTFDGPANITSDGVATLSQAIRLAGRFPLPLPGPAFEAGRLLWSPATLLGGLPFDPAFLRFACVADAGRARAALGYTPQHTAVAALAELTRARSPEAAL